ncbi:MFS transporter [Sneathiella aquimaris]|uniref:MFS transporter n=1 Tax=Sneathiella aquimaris TaxID=2599305 RepID=UPI00146C2074|nr:MFS transporter [Sneathiella aquimaris]
MPPSFSTASQQGVSSTDYLDSRYSWVRLFVSVLLATLGSGGMWSIIVILPQVQDEFGINRGEASLAFTAVMIGFGLGNLIVGRLVDRFGIFIPLLLSCLLISGGFYLSTVVSSFWLFSVIQGTMIGLGTSTLFGPLMSDISHWFFKRLGIAIATAASGNYFAGCFWPLFIKDIVATEGWREAYSLVSIILLATMLPLAMMLRRKVPSKIPTASAADQPTQTMRGKTDLQPNMLQGLLVIAGIGCCVAMSMPQVHIVAYSDDLGYGIERGAEMLSLMLAGGIVSRLASGFLADLFGGIKTLLLGSVLQCIGLILYMPFDGLMALYIISFIFGLSQGGIVPSYAIIVREYLPAHEAGQRVGLVILATVAGMALGGWLSGLIYDLTQSYRAAFINGIGWNLLNIGIMTFVLWRSRLTLQPG